jgi:hypothetical protein
MARAGDGGDRWYPVGRGWFLVSVQVPPVAKWASAGTALELLAPNGAVHRVYSAGDSFAPSFWSGDGRRALVFGPQSIAGTVVDLVSGVATPVRLPPGSYPVGFTPSPGLGILTYAQSPNGLGTLQRRSLNGADPVTLARDVTSAGDPFDRAVTTEDGRDVLVVQGGDFVLVPVSGAEPITRVRPAGSCIPVRLWSKTELLAQCNAMQTGRGWLEVQPLSGAAPRVIARDGTGDEVAVNLNAFPASGGVYSRTATGCGPGWISRVGANGAISPLLSTDGKRYWSTLLTSDGTNLAVVMEEADCMGGHKTSLIWMNPQTLATRTLFSADSGQSPMFLPFPTYNGME